MSKKPEVTILLTAHNEADVIESVIRDFYEICKKVPAEILVVEDGSTDGTKEILRKLSKEIPLKLLMSETRRGYSKAVVEGLRHVNTKYVFFSDGDGQHQAHDFWDLFPLRDMYDIVSGWRVKRADAFHRRLMSRVFQFMIRVIFRLPKLHDITAPYKLMRSEVAKLVSSEWKYMKESFWSEFTVRALKRGFSICEVPVSHRRRVGKSSTKVYKPWKIPRIVISQLAGLLKLWIELKRH